MSQILAIEASTEQCSVALRIGNKNYSRVDNTPRAHAQNLLPMVKALLASCDYSLNKLDAIAYGEGPGSFTGLRIALGIAQGLAYGADLPMVNVCGLNALGYEHFDQSDTQEQGIVTILDARMGEVYWDLFFVDQGGSKNMLDIFQHVKPLLSPVSDVESLIEQRLKHLPGSDSEKTNSSVGRRTLTKIVGNGFDLLSDKFQDKYQDLNIDASPLALSMLDLAESKFLQGQVSTPDLSEPKYLRHSVAWNKRNRIRPV